MSDVPNLGRLEPHARAALLEVARLIREERERIDDILGATSTVDHGALVGLAGDDHTHYALADGTRGNFEVTGAAAAAEAAAKAYADTQDDSHSTADRLYADGEDDAHSTADRAYADGEDDAHSAADRAYTDAEVAAEAAVRASADSSLQTQITDHLNDTIDAHDATAISFNGVGLLLGYDEVQSAVDQTMAVAADFRNGDVDKIITMLNAWTAPDGEVTGVDFLADNILTDTLVTRIMAAGAIAAGKLSANAVQAGNVDANVITAREVAAKAITAEKLNVRAPGGNLLRNGALQDGTGFWHQDRGAPFSTFEVITDATTTPANQQVLKWDGSYTALASEVVPVVPGRKYRITWKRKNTDTSYTQYHRIVENIVHDGGEFLDWAGRTSYSELGTPGEATKSVWTTYDFTYIPPANINFISLQWLNWGPNTGNFAYVTDFKIEEIVPSVLIEDGAVTAQKFNASIGVGGDNLLVNSDYEYTDADSLYPFYTSTRTYDTAHGGIHGSATAAKIVTDGGGTLPSGYYHLTPSTVSLQANEKYTISLWIKFVDVGLPFKVGGRYANNIGSFLGHTNFPFVSTGGWQEVKITGLSWTAAYRPGLQVYVDTVDNTVPRTFYVDRPMLSVGDVAQKWRPNVSELAPGSVLADHISVTDLQAIGATIGGWSIDTTRIFNTNIQIDNSLSQIKLGSHATENIWINGGTVGANNRIRVGLDALGGLGAGGVYMDGGVGGRFSAGKFSTGKGIKWDGTTFSVAGAVQVGGTITSDNYAYTSGDFATAGVEFDMTTGRVRAKNWAVTAAGDAKFKGDVTAKTFICHDGASAEILKLEADVSSGVHQFKFLVGSVQALMKWRASGVQLLFSGPASFQSYLEVKDTRPVVAATGSGGYEACGEISLLPANWTNATLVNSWVAYGASDHTPGYRKNGDRVELRGMMKNGATSTGAQLFVLPAGSRPTKAVNAVCMSANGIHRLSISAAGSVNVHTVGGDITISSTWLNIDNISFSVTA